MVIVDDVAFYETSVDDVSGALPTLTIYSDGWGLTYLICVLLCTLILLSFITVGRGICRALPKRLQGCLRLNNRVDSY